MIKLIEKRRVAKNAAAQMQGMYMWRPGIPH